jgi:hypothetical protein
MEDDEIAKFTRMAQAKHKQNDAALEAELDELMKDDPDFKPSKKGRKKSSNSSSIYTIIY